MKAYLKRRLPSAIAGALSLLVMWLVWFVAHKTVKNEYVLPSFSQTLSAFWIVLGEAFFWRALFKTLLKVVYSFLISFALALCLSLLTKIFKHLGAFMKPIVSVIRTLPTMAVLVLILIYTDKMTAPIIVSVLVLFPMIYAQFNTALQSVDEGIINATKVFNLTKSQKTFKVFLPMVAPPVFSHVGSNLSFAIKIVISAEVMAYSFTSIGGMMQTANVYFDIPRLAALTLVAVILGLVIEGIFNLVCRACFKWQRSEVAND